MSIKAILFDIDGTLLSVDYKLVRTAIANCMRKINIDPSILATIQFAGRTDRSIFSELVGSDFHHLYEPLKENYIKSMSEVLTRDHIQLLDGVEEALTQIKSTSSYFLGLLSGNFEETGWQKVKSAGIDNHFKYGAFGCHDHKRSDLVKSACSALMDSKELQISSPSDIAIVGDTPNDIQAAHNAGATSVAISTGPYSYNELNAHRPTYLLEKIAELPNCI